MNITIACDHAALDQKNILRDHLKAAGHAVQDCGVHTNDSVDYPDYAREVCHRVGDGRAELGVLLCGTGVGMAIAANKVRGIRAALLSDAFSARMSREHNNANVICFGARVLGIEAIKTCADAFLATIFQGGKHEGRVRKMMDMEGGEKEVSASVKRDD